MLAFRYFIRKLLENKKYCENVTLKKYSVFLFNDQSPLNVFFRLGEGGLFRLLTKLSDCEIGQERLVETVKKEISCSSVCVF